MTILSLYHSKLKKDHFYPQIIAYYYKQWHDSCMPVNFHKAIKLMYIVSGECIVEVDDGKYALQKGHLLLIDAETNHRLVVRKNCPCRLLNFEFTFSKETAGFPSIKQLAESEPAIMNLLNQNEPFLLLKDNSEVHKILKDLALELDRQKSDNELMVHLLFSELLIRMARMMLDATDQTPEQADFYIKRVIDFIHDNYDRDIKVTDMAEEVKLNPSYLHRLFKSYMEMTIIDYLTELRVRKAKMLLSQTEIPITEISDYIGINTRQYFSTIFKKHTGFTPLDFRKTFQNSTEKRADNRSQEVVHQ